VKRSLIVFVKEPVAGRVKTRLTPPLSPEESRDLYACFLEDGLRQYIRVAGQLDLHLQICYSPAESAPFFESLVTQSSPFRNLHLHPQYGGDLGRRMENALARSFSGGYEHLVIIGSDHPTLPDAFIAEAYDRLSGPACDAVIGKAEDGGYYLIGMKKILDCFHDIPWSTTSVFEQTMKKLDGFAVHVLPEWYDVDDVETLKRCASEIRSGAAGTLPARTAEYLEHLNFLKVG